MRLWHKVRFKSLYYSNQKCTDKKLWSVMLYNRLTNIPNLCICIGTHYITHSSSIITTYSCERFNGIITTTRSKYQSTIRRSSQRYRSLGCLITAPEISKDTRNRPFTKVGLPPLVLQASCVHWKFIWCLPITFVFLIWSWMAELNFLGGWVDVVVS